MWNLWKNVSKCKVPSYGSFLLLMLFCTFQICNEIILTYLLQKLDLFLTARTIMCFNLCTSYISSPFRFCIFEEFILFIYLFYSFFCSCPKYPYKHTYVHRFALCKLYLKMIKHTQLACNFEKKNYTWYWVSLTTWILQTLRERFLAFSL